MIFKQVEWQEASGIPEHDWEEVPSEDLWEDGELSATEVQHKILHHTFQEGDWIIIRRTNNEQ